MNNSDKKSYGVYVVYDDYMEVMYIGSTGLSLDKLEYNHRNYDSLGYSSTDFRRALAVYGQKWTFAWGLRPRMISREQIEIEEGALIRFVGPLYNKSMFPYERSVHEGRFERKL